MYRPCSLKGPNAERNWQANRALLFCSKCKDIHEHKIVAEFVPGKPEYRCLNCKCRRHAHLCASELP